MADKTYYEVLGIEHNASPEEIRSAYKRLAVQYHPDKNKNSTEAKQRFQQISEAHQVLTDEDKRRAYDLTLEQVSDLQQQYSNEKTRHHLHQTFSVEKLKAEIEKISGGKGRIEAVPAGLPRWVTSYPTPSVSTSAAIVPFNDQQLIATSDAQYDYTREFDTGVGKARLDLTSNTQRVYLDYSKDENMRASVELAKASGWQGIKVPDNLPKEKLERFEALCKEHNMAFETYAYVAPAPTQKVDDVPSSTPRLGGG